MASSSSRARSRSPFSHRKPSSPYSSASSSSSLVHHHHRLIPRSCSSSASSYLNSGGGFSGSRSMTPSRGRSESVCNGARDYGNVGTVGFPVEELIAEPVEPSSRAGDSISVTIRFRPLSEREFQRGDEIAWYADGDKFVRNEYNPATAYAFDKVFGPQTNTQDVYEVAAQPVVRAAMEGVNGTVFAYGVTSSGKTHTMHGDHYSPGVIPLAIKDVFSIIQDTPGREFLLRVSYLEIYNEVINDLLDPTGQNLRVREDAQGTYVEGIKEEVVLSPGHVLSFIAAGEEHRHVGSNNFNLFSSRSHTIFTLMIESSAHGDEYDGVIFSQLNLIDLAGSESSKTETTGLRRKEGSYINKSLLTLGTVIGKLSEGKACHVPYRDSKLTRLLQSSLSGHGHVSLICTITPASSNMEETHNTLKFASRAKRVEIYASRNKIIDEKSLIKKYQREISCLKTELDQLKKGIIVGVNHEELLTLKQKFEEGQVKMQSRLEEEEEAKAALMSRIQRLTKLILVSTKNTIPGCLGDIHNHQNNHSMGSSEDNKLDVLQGDSLSVSAISSDLSDLKHRSSSKWNEELSPSGSTVTEATHGGITLSDQMDLLVEQVKMLAGEIAFSTSTLKRLVEQSVNDPESSKTQIQNLESEIQEKRRQMRLGSGYLLYKLYDAHQSRLNDLERELADAREKEELIKTQMQAHFENIQSIADTTTLPHAMRYLSDRVAEEVDLSHLTERLMKEKGQRNTLTTSEKLELWDKLKILSFTRMVLSLWAMTMLSLYIRVQVNILGRHLYIDTARVLGSSRILDEDDLIIDRDDQQKFLASSDFLSSDGMVSLISDMHLAVKEVLKGKKLGDTFSTAMVHETIMQILDTFMSMRSAHHWVDYLMPEDSKSHRSAEPSSSGDDIPPEATKFDQLMSETRAVLLSAEFGNVADISLKAVVDALVEDMANQAGGGSLASGMPLARLFPRVAHMGPTLLVEPSENRFISIIKNVPEVELFFTLLYASIGS